MTMHPSTEGNAKFFPNDSLWQKHCAKVAAYLKSIPAVTSKPGWDGREDIHKDYLDIRPLSRSASTAVEEIQSRRVLGVVR